MVGCPDGSSPVLGRDYGRGGGVMKILGERLLCRQSFVGLELNAYWFGYVLVWFCE